MYRPDPPLASPRTISENDGGALKLEFRVHGVMSAADCIVLPKPAPDVDAGVGETLSSSSTPCAVKEPMKKSPALDGCLSTTFCTATSVSMSAMSRRCPLLDGAEGSRMSFDMPLISSRFRNDPAKSSADPKDIR